MEGKFSPYIPAEPKLGNYKKTKDIAVAIGVSRNNFHDRNEFERKEFVADSTLQAVKLVKARLVKKKLNIDFDALLNDVQKVTEEYLKKAIIPVVKPKTN